MPSSSSPFDNDSEAIRSYIASYVPSSVAPHIWDGALEDFVRSQITRLDLTFLMMRRVMRELAQLGGFCVERGIALDVEQVLDPDTVERFIAEGLGDFTVSSRAAIRTDLCSIGPLLTKRAPWQPPAQKLSRKTLTEPYTAKQVDIIWRDAQAQRSTLLTISASVIVCLGLGAGLDGRWLTRVTGSDVRRVGNNVVVTVGAPNAREIVVRQLYARELLRLAGCAGDRALIKPTGNVSKNTVATIATEIRIDQGRIHLNTSRLRSTWLVAHLNARTPMLELLEAAGVKGFGSFDDLLPFVRRMNRGQAHSLMRAA